MQHRARTTFWAASAVTFLILAGCSTGSDAMRYDPEIYKEHIEKIENLIHKAKAEPGDQETLSKHVNELAGAMGKDIENYRYREIVMNRLITFGDYFVNQATFGVEMDLAEARETWKPIRDELFEPADWFQ